MKNKLKYIKARISANRVFKAANHPLALEIERAQIIAAGGMRHSQLTHEKSFQTQLIGIGRKPMTRGQARLDAAVRNGVLYHNANTRTI